MAGPEGSPPVEGDSETGAACVLAAVSARDGVDFELAAGVLVTGKLVMPVLMKLSASWCVVCLSAKALHILCSFLLLAWRRSQTRMTALRCRKLWGAAP